MKRGAPWPSILEVLAYDETLSHIQIILNLFTSLTKHKFLPLLLPGSHRVL